MRGRSSRPNLIGRCALCVVIVTLATMALVRVMNSARQHREAKARAAREAADAAQLVRMRAHTVHTPMQPPPSARVPFVPLSPRQISQIPTLVATALSVSPDGVRIESVDSSRLGGTRGYARVTSVGGRIWFLATTVDGRPALARLSGGLAMSKPKEDRTNVPNWIGLPDAQDIAERMVKRAYPRWASAQMKLIEARCARWGAQKRDGPTYPMEYVFEWREVLYGRYRTANDIRMSFDPVQRCVYHYDADFAISPAIWPKVTADEATALARAEWARQRSDVPLSLVKISPAECALGGGNAPPRWHFGFVWQPWHRPAGVTSDMVPEFAHGVSVDGITGAVTIQ